MRIAWFTPYSTQSAVGQFSRHVTAALAEHADVDVWTSDEAPLHDSDLPVIRFAAADALDERLGRYQALVHNMGNHRGFHREIYEVSRRHPGIVILHDRVLHHLFAAMWLDVPSPVEDVYISRMAAYYGDDGERVARESLAGLRPKVWERDDEAVRYPLDEQALLRALGAVTHSEEHARYLAGRWLGPVRALQLPCYREVLEMGALAGQPPPRRADGRIQVTTIGHVIANKHVAPFVRLLAGDDELARLVHYTVLGALDAGSPYATQLEGLLRSTPEVSAELLGWRDDAELQSLMAATDVFVNLRHPVMESGSASLARELAFGRPIVCFDAGSFGEVPPGAVARVAAGDFDAVKSELWRLVTDERHRRELGANARRAALARSEADYARALIEFIAETQRAEPTLRLLDRVAGELGAMHADPGLPVYDTIADDFGRVLRL